ncbi:actin-binding protein IPP-like [Saccoglossus kowalevskii]|uniref:Actin-binding protein IPP-like n=1 Tax=Saccoglossus kowalevskii TaxID=10224 RepID=A0ABM0GPL1_SACKO|nr:PREDICTED: actin-binding protein IPP-like [Saccoglossus kowalevskii]
MTTDLPNQTTPIIVNDRLQFSSKNHASALLSQLCKLRGRHEFCDVQFIVGKDVYHCHRVVMSACSPYFNVMFSGGLSETSKSEVDIHEIHSSIFKVLLDFIYTGEVEVTSENVQELLSAADMLELPEVVQACSSFLQSQLHSSNCIGISRFAEIHFCTDLKRAAEAFMSLHFLEVCQEEEYFDIKMDDLVTLLRSENLRIENEYQVFLAALGWILHDVGKRRKYLVQILDAVRFALISPRQLFEYINSCEDLSLRVALGMLLAEYNPDRKPQQVKPTRSLSKKTLVQVRPRLSAMKHLYVIGGYCYPPGGRWSDSQSLSAVEQFDSFNQVWCIKSSLIYPRSGHGVAVVEGSIYAIGGESDSLIYDSVERYEPGLNQWVEAPSLTVPRCGLGVCTIGQVIYAFGGWIGSEMGKTIECYDPDIGKWCVIGNMKTLRISFGIAELDGNIYCVGGTSDLNTEMRLAEYFDPITQDWIKLPDMKSRRTSVALGVLNDCLYAVGGWNDRKRALNTVERYSVTEKKWSTVAPLSTARAGASVASINGLLYVVGGRTNSKENTAPLMLDSVECYDPHTDSWIHLGSMPTGRCETAIAVL